MLYMAQSKHNAVEGTHRDPIQAVLTLNHSTTLLTGSAAYSLQDTLYQETSYCSNHGMPPVINKVFSLLIMCQYSVVMSQHYTSVAKSKHLT